MAEYNAANVTIDEAEGVAVLVGDSQYIRGQDGVSPVVAVEEIPGGHRITITDASGAHSFDVMDGGGGALPSGGTDGQYLVKDSTEEGGAKWAELPAYGGAWSVTPLASTQTTLETAQTYLDRDIVVEAIPYAEVSNISGGMTATIGG